MNVQTVVVGPFQVNCYLYYDEASKLGVIIDPGAEEHAIVKAVEKAGFRPLAILLTHGHADHIAAVAPLMDRYNIPLYAGKGEEALLADPSLNMSAFVGAPLTAPTPDTLLNDNELVQVGPIELRVLTTPGHSPGGICYLDERAAILFCGDTLFWGSVGRTDFPGCSHEQLIDSINRQLLPLPPSVICYPGHGPTTTIGGEKRNNPFLSGSHFV